MGHSALFGYVRSVGRGASRFGVSGIVKHTGPQTSRYPLWLATSRCHSWFLRWSIDIGRLFDLTHSYITGFEIAALIAAIGSAAAFLCTAPSPVKLGAIVQPQKSTV
jgi:hypothetical protein